MFDANAPADFHMHSKMSDGQYDVDNLIGLMTDVIDSGHLSRFGITDHYWPKFPNAIHNPQELANYFKTLREWRAVLIDYKKLRPNELLIGVEIYCKDGVPELQKELIQLADYVLLEHAADKVDAAIDFSREHQLPVGLAHPYYVQLKGSEKKIADAGIFLELNAGHDIDPDSYLTDTTFFMHLPENLKFSLASDFHRGVYPEYAISTLEKFAHSNKLPLVDLKPRTLGAIASAT